MVKFKKLMTTLDAGVTSYTFTDSLINNDSVIEVYTDNDDIYPVDINQAGSSVAIELIAHSEPVRLAITINNFNTALEYSAGENITISDSGVISSTGGSGSSELAELTDVSLSGLQGGNLLMYNHNMQKWVNAFITSDAVGDSVFGSVRDGLAEHDQEIGELQEGKQNKLTAGTNITIVDDVISATGGSGGSSSLAELDDVQLTTPADKNLLMYNSTLNKWVNANITSDEVGDINFGTVKDGLSTINGNVQEVAEDLTGAISSINTLTQDVLDIQGDVEDIQTDVGTLQTNVGTLQTNVGNLTTGKQDKLTAGTNITIDDNNVISAAGGSAEEYYKAGDVISFPNGAYVFGLSNGGGSVCECSISLPKGVQSQVNVSSNNLSLSFLRGNGGSYNGPISNVRIVPPNNLLFNVSASISGLRIYCAVIGANSSVTI